MRLGILTDIHESLSDLRLAIEILKARGVDRLVFNGDVCRMCEDLERTVAILAEEGVVGVWGNHDFGLCQQDFSDELRERHGEAVLSYMRTLRPRMVFEDCLFTHVEPWLDTESLEDLWWFEGLPETAERLGQSFAAVPQRVMFIGHFHRWFLGTQQGPIDWNGEKPITLEKGTRYLVGVNAVCEGWCASYDTETGELTPINVWEGRDLGLNSTG